MKLTKSSSKNSTTYYVQKSYRIGDKTSTKTVERLGSIEELKARAGDKDPIEWAKEYVKKLTLSEKESRKDITVKYSGSRQIDKNVRKSVNVGYLFLKKIYNELRLPKVVEEISEKYKITYDLDDIFSSLLPIMSSPKSLNFRLFFKFLPRKTEQKMYDSHCILY